MARIFPLSLSSLGLPLGAIAAFGVIIGLQVPRLGQVRTATDTLTPAQITQEVTAEEVRLQLWRKMPSFGFDNLLADWVFLQFTQYFGDDLPRKQTGFTLSPRYFDIIVDRDPRFLGAYISLSTSISLYAGQPEKSIALMDRGLKSMTPQSPPRSYFVWRLKAIDQLLFLGDGLGAKTSFQTSANWSSAYPDQESQVLTQTSRQTAQFLERNPKSKNAQVLAWTMVLTNATDPQTKKIAKQRLESLGARLITNPDGSLGVLGPPTD